MPKITNEVARAVRNATRLMPWFACPCPRTAVVVAALEELVVEDILTLF